MKVIFQLVGMLGMGGLLAMGLKSLYEGLTYRGRPLHDILTKEHRVDEDLNPPNDH